MGEPLLELCLVGGVFNDHDGIVAATLAIHQRCQCTLRVTHLGHCP
jgi:hypothetical protein